MVSTAVGVTGGSSYASGTPLASFSSSGPLGLAFWGYNLYMSDPGSNVIWKLNSPNNTVLLYAGPTSGGAAGSADGPATSGAAFNGPGQLSVDDVGNIFVIDQVSMDRCG